MTEVGVVRRLVVVGALVAMLAAVVVACAPPSSIVGTVSAPVGPVAGATVTAFGLDAAPVSSTVSGADGTYTLASLPAATYRVQATAGGVTVWSGGASSFATAASVVVTADAVTALNLVLPSNPGTGTTTTTTSTSTTSTSTTSTSSTTTTSTSTTTTTVVPPPATRPILMGSATSTFGNDPANAATCPSYQPSSAAPCGPQPMRWSSIDGPYYAFAQGDPYWTKCAPNGTSTTNGDPATCDDAGAPNGAKNPLYKPEGARFAVDVGPADLGRPLSVQVYDIGDYPRTVGPSTTSRTVTGVSTTAGSPNLTANTASGFTTADVGATVTGVGLPAGAAITSVADVLHATMSVNATASGSGRSITLSSPATVDCPTDQAPFSAYASFSSVNCQTGDSGAVNTDVQLYDNDGNDATASLGTPLGNCRLVVPKETPTASTAATFKNRWAQLCTFTPTMTGIYPLTVKTSHIAGIPDDGVGNNAFALRVTGGTAATSTTVRAIDDMGIWANVPTSNPHYYLADVDSSAAGRTLVVDLYDVGDGSGQADYAVQLLAPPAGAPAVVPTGGTTTPCSFNATGSATKGPATPDVSSTCTIVTKSAGAARYDASWLRVRIPIPVSYTCSTDCWWSVAYLVGAGGVPTDRTVWSVSIEG